MNGELKWKTIKVKVKDLKGLSVNPRKINKRQKAILMKSLEKFDLVEIPVINVDKTIIAGHQRIAVLKALGREDDEIEVRVPNRKLTDDEVKEYCVRSNIHNADWDFDLLKENFELDMLLDAGFDEKLLNEMFKPEKEDDKELDFSIPEMELKEFERYDYLVFVFKNELDWLHALQKFGVDKVNASFVDGKRRIGLGRVLDGKVLLD